MTFWKGWSDGKKWAMGIISALIISVIVGSVNWLIKEQEAIPRQEVSFVASSEDTPFAIKSRFEGIAIAEGLELRIKVNNAIISYPRSIGGSNSRSIEDIRVTLAEPREGSWDLVRSSNRLDLDLELEAGNREEIEPFELVIPLQGLDTISGYWLVFDIA
jgi:hypothetical protein